MKSSTILTLAIAFSTLITACGEQTTDSGEVSNAEITTDVINNPNSAASTVDPETMPIMTFEEDVFEFGQISQGEKVQHSFTFTNSGKSDLVISSASGSCGCTVPSWPKEPIAAGATSQIDVVFDSNGKEGKQHKTVTIVANTLPNKTVIVLKGEVIAPDKQQ